MKRNYELFPEDDSGDALWSLHTSGDKFTKPREVDFSVIFPSEEAAMSFAMHLLRNGQKVSCGPYEGDEELPWQVQVHPIMIPTYEAVTQFEALLASDAAPLGGRNDGWGCFEVL